jgi:outer membrane protein assembly factor BamA
MAKLLFILIPLLLSPVLAAEWQPEERRKGQYPTSPAHLLVPLPYSMPGIGEGFFLMGYLANMFETTADVAAVVTTGDASGTIIQLDELPLWGNQLQLSLFGMNISRAQLAVYRNRGMESAANDYTLSDLSALEQLGATLKLSLFERRFEISLNYADQFNRISAIRDADGQLLTANGFRREVEGSRSRLGFKLDLTDDYLDPRRGWRLNLDLADQPARKSDDADFYVVDLSLLGYLPINGGDDTVVLNYFRSSANVRRMGLVDRDAVAAQAGSERQIENTLAANRYGTASALGGRDRLRSYPEGRFSGGQSEFVGIEWRINFVRDAHPFDYFIWRDVTTSLQLALFAEVGTVAETSADLWQQRRSSYGIGGRLLSASGSVYRADFAYGGEGGEFTIFFFYPWN